MIEDICPSLLLISRKITDELTVVVVVVNTHCATPFMSKIGRQTFLIYLIFRTFNLMGVRCVSTE